MGSANDGGGSIRIPAACCGLFGMKLSRGRVSLGDYIGEQWGGAVSEGLVTRSVRDSAVYYDLVMGPGRGEPYVVDKPAVPFSEEIQKQPGSLRIAYTLDHPLGHSLDEDTIKAMNETVALLQSLGHKIEQIKLPYPKEVLTEMLFMLVVGETSAELSLIERYTGRKVTHRHVEPNTWMLSELGRAYSAHDFALAKKTWNEVGRKMGLLHDSYDIFLTPTLGRKPIKIGELQNPPIEEAALKIFNTLGLSSLLRHTGIVDKIADKIYSYIPYTPLQNITGQPSMSVPLYWSPSDQLPVGMMFSSAINNEAVLWRLAAQLEQAKPWFDRVPS
jgi:amidase